MKKIIAILIIVFGITGVASASWYNPLSWFGEIKKEINLGATYLFPYQGGTGTSTAPTYGQMLVGNSGGTYTLTATSSLGITGVSADWVKQTNYGVLNLTASTTIPYWAKDAFYASSTSVFQGNLEFDAELLPDGSTCANGEILKKTGANDWDCASDSTGSAVGTVSTSTTPIIGNLAYWTSTAYPSLLGTVATTTPTMTAPLTYSGTLGSFVGGVAGAFDCTSATGSVKGCLTSADWTTFNNKQASISATWPITLTGATVGFDGLSTSTAAVLGNIPYFSGVNTFANVATTSLTATSPLSLSQPISVIGSSASALTISVAGDWTGTIDSNNFAGGAIGAGELIYGGSAGSFSELALGTNGYVLALSGGIPAWVATTTLSTISGTLDISSQSNLTAGTGITLTGDDLSIDTSQNIATLSNLTSNGFIKTGGGVGTLSVDTSTYLTTVDISANTNLAATAPIVLTGDTLSLGNITMYPAFTYATSSASFTGTTTIPLGVAMVAETWNSVSCFTDAGTVWLAFDDGTNVMNYLQASTTVGVFTLSTNNSFSVSEKRYVKFGNSASSPTRISCTVSKSFSAN